MTTNEIEAVGESVEEAKKHILSQIPKGLSIISEEIVSTGEPIKVIVDANTEDDARNKARERPLAIESVELSSPAVNGLFGFGKRPAQYKITYKTKAKVRGLLGVRYCQSCGSPGAKKRGAPNLNSWFCDEVCDKRFHDQFFQFTSRDIGASGGIVVSLSGPPLLAGSVHIVIFCAYCAARNVLPPNQTAARAATCNICNRKML
jgi:hypothetical protein